MPLTCVPRKSGALAAFIRARAAEYEARFGDDSSERIAAALRAAADSAEGTLHHLAGEEAENHARVLWDVLLGLAAPWGDHRDYDPRWSVSTDGCPLLPEG
ncbi:hypothetical protein ACIRVF_39335 [Kitasatospora sp. NPDC101157]|uniref:hypothetical protein n=1 Tax=Kitasatospora sp. NPDC101157 TaxID=3364098 RepID=UPI0037FE8887